MIRFLTSGESHGKSLVTIVEGVPAGLPVTEESINRDLGRRQKGFGRGNRQKIERDQVQILSGVRFGETLGSPITLMIPNLDAANWGDIMGIQPPPDPVTRVTKPRPGHADLAGLVKYGRNDIRDILERASARETAARCAAGAIAKSLLGQFGIGVHGHVVSVGDARCEAVPAYTEGLLEATEESPVRCPDTEASRAMMEAIDKARDQGDTLGGIFEVRAMGLPPGLGSHVHWDRRLDGRLASSLMSLNGIKGVEIGLGFASATRPGSQVHDPVYRDRTPPWRYSRAENNAGGLEGGMTNGETLVLRAAMKPIATLRQPLPSVDLDTGEAVMAHHERSDVCAVPTACVVGEAVVALALAVAFQEKFGGDSVSDMMASYHHYMSKLASI